MNCNLESEEYRKEILKVGYVVSAVAGNKKMKDRVTISDIYEIISLSEMFDEEYREYKERG